MNSAGYIYRAAKRRGPYLALFTDPEPVSRMKKENAIIFVNKRRHLLSTLFTF